MKKPPIITRDCFGRVFIKRNPRRRSHAYKLRRAIRRGERNANAIALGIASVADKVAAWGKVGGAQ